MFERCVHVVFYDVNGSAIVCMGVHVSKFDKSPNSTCDRVYIQLPRMNIPFSNCDPFDKSPEAMRQLIVDFKGENTDLALQQFREFMNRLSWATKLLCDHKEQVNALRRYVPIIADTLPMPKLYRSDDVSFVNVANVAPLIKAQDKWHDKMILKFEPDEASFLAPDGETLNESLIDFKQFDVEALVWFKDVWKFNDCYYPRLFLIRAELYPKKNDL